MKKDEEVLGHSGYSRIIDDEQLKNVSDIKKAYEQYMDDEIKQIGCGFRVGSFNFSLKSIENDKYLMEISCSYRRKENETC